MNKTTSTEISNGASCIFCKIVKGEIPAEKVYENNETVVLMDVRPSSPGHIMVIPKKHGVSVIDFEEKELGQIMNTVKKMAEIIPRALQNDSITIGINHLEADGVPHLHIHLIPRWNDDGYGALQTIVENPPKEDLKSIAEKIRKETTF